jgi:hypothetical protein
MLDVPASAAHPLAVNLFFVAIVAFVTALCVDVARRWLFWLVLLAFLISPLEIPAGILQLLNIISIQQPA